MTPPRSLGEKQHKIQKHQRCKSCQNFIINVCTTLNARNMKTKMNRGGSAGSAQTKRARFSSLKIHRYLCARTTPKANRQITHREGLPRFRPCGIVWQNEHSRHSVAKTAACVYTSPKTKHININMLDAAGWATCFVSTSIPSLLSTLLSFLAPPLLRVFRKHYREACAAVGGGAAVSLHTKASSKPQNVAPSLRRRLDPAVRWVMCRHNHFLLHARPQKTARKQINHTMSPPCGRMTSCSSV